MAVKPAAMANKTTVNTSKLRLRLLPAGLAMICGSEAACKVCSAGDSVGLGVSLILFSCGFGVVCSSIKAAT